MTLENLSTESSNFYAPRFEVEIRHKKLRAEMEKAIIDISVTETINRGASFELTVHDEFDMETQEFRWLDHELFDVGNEICIKMGYGNRLDTMIIGSITRLEPSFFAGDTPTLRVIGQDISYDVLKRASPERSFIGTYSDVARIIASEARLNAVVDDTRFRTTVRKRNDETYYSFLNRLRREVGYEFRIEGRKMYFVRPRNEEREILTLELGKDIISFAPTMRTSGLLTEVEFRGYDPSNPRTPIIGRAGTGSESGHEAGEDTGSQVAQRYGTVKRVITGVVNSREEAEAHAEAELNEASGSLVEGRVECIGIPQIRAGVNVKIEKVGSRFSGKYYVVGSTHRIGSNGYKTSFFVGRNSVEHIGRA
jgi:phage protein D